MLCAAGWAMYAVVRALKEPSATARRQLPKWWLVAGVSIGLAMASKYTSVLLPAALVAAFVSHPRLQNEFGKPGPYLAVAVASAVLLPVLWWNATHDWVSFKFQLGHGLGEPKGGALGAVNREVELIGGQIGLVSPILFYFVVRAVKRQTYGEKSHDQPSKSPSPIVSIVIVSPPAVIDSRTISPRSIR